MSRQTRRGERPDQPAEGPRDEAPTLREDPVDPAAPNDDDEVPALVDDLFDEEQGAQKRTFLYRKLERKRVDVYLQERIGSATRSKIQKLIELGGVTVNGQPPKASTKLRQGDEVVIVLPPMAVREIRAEPIPLQILYEDDDLLVVNKQADLIVHPARGNLSGTLLNGLAWHFQQKGIAGAAAAEDEPGAKVAGLSEVGSADYRPGIVHRLDRYTTGVMVVAKRDETHWMLARQFELRSPLKVYLALVHGSPDGEGGVIDQPLGKHPTIREAYAVRHDDHGKPSVTLYRVRERYQGYSLVELELKSGRTHQIRIHLSYMGWPIVGDIVYGGEPVGEREIATPPIAAASRRMITYARNKAEGQRMEADALARPDMLMTHPALHACLLRIEHPVTRQDMTFSAPLHAPMNRLVRALRERPAEGPVTQRGHHIDLAKVVW